MERLAQSIFVHRVARLEGAHAKDAHAYYEASKVAIRSALVFEAQHSEALGLLGYLRRLLKSAEGQNSLSEAEIAEAVARIDQELGGREDQ